MKLDRTGSYMLLQIVLLALSLLLTVQAGVEAGRYLEENVYYITPRINRSEHAFSSSEVQALQGAGALQGLAWTRQSSGLLQLGNVSVYAQLLQTNPDYFTLTHQPFYSGGPWQTGDTHALILNTTLTWQLFGSLDVLGLTVTLDGQVYTVTGVLGSPDQVREDPWAYLPLDLEATDGIAETVLLQTAAEQPQFIETTLSTWLLEQGKDSRDYYIADLDRYQKQVALKARLLGLAVGLSLAYSLFANGVRLLRWTLDQHRSWAPLLLIGVLFFVVLALVVLFFQEIAPDFWIPHSGDSRWRDLFQAITNQGALPDSDALPTPLDSLCRCNSRANAGLLLGLAALASFLWLHRPTKDLPHTSRKHKSEAKKQFFL